jgi:hypothetical protein
MLRNILLSIVISILSISVYAQNGNSGIQALFEQGKINEACVEITTHIADSIIQSQNANSDPYGFAFTLKLSTKSGNDTSYSLYRNLPALKMAKVLSDKIQKGENMKIANPYEYPVLINGKFFYECGLFPPAGHANSSGFNVYAITYSYSIVQAGEKRHYRAQASASFAYGPPENGSISGIVSFHGEQGHEPWVSSKTNRGMDGTGAKIDMKRLGPGTDKSNSKNMPFEWGTRIDMAAESGFYSVVDLNPGVYIPVIEFRGCFHEYDQMDFRNTVKTEAHPDWNHLFRTGKPSHLSSAENLEPINFLSNFCLNNNLEGYIRDENGKLVKTPKTVKLEPKFNSEDPNIQQAETQSENGYYLFEDIPTGEYEVWVVGEEKTKKKTVELCNYPQYNEEPNITYRQDFSVKSKRYFYVMETYIDHEDIYLPQESGKLGICPMGMEHTVTKSAKLIEIRNEKVQEYGTTYFDAYSAQYDMADKSKILDFYSTLYRVNHQESRWEKYSNERPEDDATASAKLYDPDIDGRLFVDSDKFTFNTIVNEERYGYTEGFSEATMRNDKQSITWGQLKRLSSPLKIEDQVILETKHRHEFNYATSEQAQETLNFLSENASSEEDKTFFDMMSGKNSLAVEPDQQIIKRKIIIRKATRQEIENYLPKEANQNN